MGVPVLLQTYEDSLSRLEKENIEYISLKDRLTETEPEEDYLTHLSLECDIEEMEAEMEISQFNIDQIKKTCQEGYRHNLMGLITIEDPGHLYTIRMFNTPDKKTLDLFA